MIDLTIPNWESYNPRNDRTNHVWFRFQNTFFSDQKVFDLDPIQKCLYIFLLCETSKTGSGTCTINTEFVAAVLRLEHESILKNISWLHDAGLLTSSAYQKPTKGRLKAGGKPDNGIATNKQTDNTVQTIQTIQTDNTKKTVSSGLTVVSPRIKAPPSFEEFLINLPLETKGQIQGIYPDQEFLVREIGKMRIWLTGNPTKNPKSIRGWLKFFMGWLERGWERYRTSIPSNRPNQEINWDYIFGTEDCDDTGSIQVAIAET